MMDLKEYREKKAELDKKVADHGKDALAREFQTFFEKFPEVGAVRWTQYTPHFNDGDECVFDRHSFEASLDFVSSLKEDSEFEDDSFVDNWSAKKGTNLKKALDHLEDVFSDTSDVFQASFGDGVQVIATRDGFHVNDYDHD
jgi:hypothetical protein